MKEKLNRFIKSIGLNPDDYLDLDFVSLKKDEFGVLNMVCLKDEPWTFKSLYNLKEAIKKIDYRYTLTFVYKKSIDKNDLITLIDDVVLNLFFDEFDYNLCLSNNKLTIELVNNYFTYKDFIPALKELFEFACLNLEVELVENVSKNDDEELLKSEEILKIKEEERKNAIKETQEHLVEEERKFIENENSRNQWKRVKKLVSYYKEVSFDNINIEDDAVTLIGKAVELDPKDLETGELRLRFTLGDFKGAITCLLDTNGRNLTIENCENIKEWQKLKVSGRLGKNNYGLFLYVHYVEILPPDPLRDDFSEEKRVELHLHTNYSEMDGVSSIEEYCQLAKHMGHKAIGVTDHAVAQAYPEAQIAAKKNGIKILYGSELYVTEDYIQACISPVDIKLKDATFVLFDTETTGLSPKIDRITEIGAIKVKGGIEVERFDELINPRMHIPEHIQEKTKITDELVKDCRTIEEVLSAFLDFVGDAILIAHNATFDYSMINAAYERIYNKRFIHPTIDTLILSRYLYPHSKSHSLGSLSKRLEIEYNDDDAHRADYDAKVLSECWTYISDELLNINQDVTLNDLAHLEITKDHLRLIRPTHVTTLVKNKTGLKNLYKIISISHCSYVGLVPLVPKKVLEEYKEGLIFGSSCFNGEVFKVALKNDKEELKNVISKFDFIEIQPLNNYSYLVNTDEISSTELLKSTLKSIIDSAKELNKMICATGDCHYANPEEKIYRDILISTDGVGKIPHPLFPYYRRRMIDKGIYFDNPDQHFLSTDEMIEAFSWLKDDDFVKEIVISNPNKIADMCDVIEPISDKLFTPHIENCNELLTELCFKTAHEKYGEVLPELIEDRLKEELKGIIDNGFAVVYYISHKLVKMTNDQGYIVGSRGSVGSSFAAFCAGITEVNPLPPHYRCPNCLHVEFHDFSDGITSGYDLPHKKCPHCDVEMIRDGQNIPFQTFLGFNAEKVPDIDLNFPADFQATAHLFTKDLLGEDKVYRAGTISKIKQKTAFADVAKSYFQKYKKIDSNEISAPYIAFLAAGCTGVKRTTGQHPGGILVVPGDMEIYDFTPIQYPANDINATWKTTHFDFHAIHDTILKFDMLGHVDPQALRMMQDLSGVDVSKIKVDDEKIISLFQNNDVLKMQHKYIKNDIGTSGIPEMGTNFVKQLIREAKPKSFKDLVIISGLSHGTNVWTHNAQDLISQGITDINGVIGCRDDIMTYLISMGIDKGLSFKIMETVRKGKRLSSEQIQIMEEKGVPDYYIDSCQKIKYLFPKGHACAYVIMALRVAYFKVYYPLVFYATFFTLRCDQYDIDTMIDGIDAIYNKIEYLKTRQASKNPEDALTPKEEGILDTLIVALEFAERGYKFLNIDINKSDSSNFLIDYEQNALIPPFKVLDGLGELGVQYFIKEREIRPFETIEDIRKRGKLPTKAIDYLKNKGILKGIKEDDSLTLFDTSLF